MLILPVATASVERVFSTMNYVKNKKSNKMGDEYLNNCLVTFIEGILKEISLIYSKLGIVKLYCSSLAVL